MLGSILRRVACGSLLTALGLACSSSPSAGDCLCTPKVEVFCRCADRTEGKKVCKADGQSFEACLPCDGTRPPAGSKDPDPLGNPLEEDDDGVAKLEAGAPKPRRDAGGGTTQPDQGVGVIDAGPPPVTDAAHCKALENKAPKVELQRVADEPTEPVGGHPTDGVYVQAWVVEFTGEGGTTAPSTRASQETIEIAGKVGRYVLDDESGHKAGGFRLATAGKKITFAYECPAAEPKELAFDSTGSTFILYDPPVARVFYRQRPTP